MLFKIEATSIYCYNKKDECEKILKQYPCLNNFGFRIEEKTEPKRHMIRDENNEHILQEDGTKTIYEPYVELDSLDELNELMFELNECLVLTPGIIEIYDTYRE
jgi:hypothetical protein